MLEYGGKVMVKRYSNTIKYYAVKLVVEDGRQVTEVAKELGLNRQTLNLWVNKFKVENEKIRNLEKENQILKNSIDFILKKQNF